MIIDGGKMKDEKHASLVEEIINYKERFYEEDEIISLKTEEHYNHYGDRGVIDIVLKIQSSYGTETTLFLIEVKPEIVNLNRTIRQIKKMNKFYRPDHSGKKGVLWIEPTEKNLDILLDYRKTIMVAFSGSEVSRYMIKFFPKSGLLDKNVGFVYPENDEDFCWQLKVEVGRKEKENL